MNDKLQKSASLKSIQISTCLNKVSEADKEIQSLNKSINSYEKKNKTLKNLTIGGFSVSAGLLILFLIK